MSYEMKTSPSSDCNAAILLAQQPYSRYSSHSSMFRANSKYLPLYSQCGDLFNSIKILSRSLNRMHVDHAITGTSAVVMEQDVAILGSESSSSEIDLVLSHQSYEHFLMRCVHQQLKPIEGEVRAFWDNRTGCTIRVYLTGERIKVGRRSIEIPELTMMLTNGEGIKCWNMESTSREGSRKLKVSSASGSSASVTCLPSSIAA